MLNRQRNFVNKMMMKMELVFRKTIPQKERKFDLEVYVSKFSGCIFWCSQNINGHLKNYCLLKEISINILIIIKIHVFISSNSWRQFHWTMEDWLWVFITTMAVYRLKTYTFSFLLLNLGKYKSVLQLVRSYYSQSVKPM